MSRSGKFWTFVFWFAYWSDWIVAGVYIWFIWNIMSMSGVSYDTLLTMGDLDHWGWANLILAIYIVPLVGYAIFFPWSFFKKRREIYFSELTNPYGWVFVIYALFFAKAFYHASYTVPGASPIGEAVHELLYIIGLVFGLGTLIASWLGGFWGFFHTNFWYRVFNLESPKRDDTQNIPLYLDNSWEEEDYQDQGDIGELYGVKEDDEYKNGIDKLLGWDN